MFPAALRRPRTGIAAAMIVLIAAAGVLALSAATRADARTAPAASATRTVSTIYGSVTVPRHATRIVTLDFPEATTLADLGVKPVGIGNYIPSLPAYTSFFTGVPDVATAAGGTPDLEKIAALHPDLIIGDVPVGEYAKYKSTYAELSQIAPTVMAPWQTAAGDWPTDAAVAAAAIGKSAQLGALRETYVKKAASIRRTYAKVLASQTIDLISASDAADFYLYAPSSSHGRVLAKAGARFGAARNQKDGYVEYSSERYSLLNRTGMVFIESNAVGSAKLVTTNTVFAGTSAAKSGRVFTTPYFFPSSYRMADALLGSFAGALQKVAR